MMARVEEWKNRLSTSRWVVPAIVAALVGIIAIPLFTQERTILHLVSSTSQSVRALIPGANASTVPLKIFVTDSDTETLLKTQQPALNHWMAAIWTIAQQRPRAIIFDGVFEWQQQPRFFISFNSMMTRIHHEYGVKLYSSGMPHPDIRKSFAATGFAPESVFVPALGAEGLPLGLWAADNVTFSDGRLVAGSRAITLHADSAVYAPSVAPSQLANQVHSLSTAINAQELGQPINSVTAGDVVVMLGRSRSVETSSAVALAYQVASNSYPTYRGGIWFGFLACVLLGAFLPVVVRKGRRLQAAAMTAGAITIIGILLDVTFAVQSPWLLELFGFTMATSGTILWKIRLRSQRRASARGTLGQLATDTFIDDFLERGQQALRRPMAVDATVMVIHFHGMNQIKDGDAEGAQSLAALREIVAREVYQAGGWLLQSISHEFECLFGLNPAGHAVANHGPVAADVALTLQKLAKDFNLQQIKCKMRVFPISIGVASGSVTVTLLDSTAMSMSGHAVDAARELAETCGIQHILVSEATHTAWRQSALTNATNQFDEKMTNEARNLGRVFDYDPHNVWPLEYLQIEQTYLNGVGITRSEDRLPVPEAVGFAIRTAGASGRVVNFSKTGLAVRLDRSLARGECFDFRLDPVSGDLLQRLDKVGIREVVGEVRWGRRVGDSFLVGLSLRNLTAGQREMLFSALHDTLNPVAMHQAA